MSDPKISVIMPTISRRQLRRAIDSVARHLGRGDELLVVGDGPQPKARNLCSEYGDRVRYLEHYDDRSDFGWAQRNYGMRLATGDVLTFLDDDDQKLPNFLPAVRRRASEFNLRLPMVFRREYHHAILKDGERVERSEPTIMWKTQVILKPGELGTGMFAVPNRPGCWKACPLDFAKIWPGYTDFIWISWVCNTCFDRFGDNSVRFCDDVTERVDGHGCGKMESAG